LEAVQVLPDVIDVALAGRHFQSLVLTHGLHDVVGCWQGNSDGDDRDDAEGDG
jgi:hypothetical protein